MTIKGTIDSYRKRRRQLMPLLLGAAAVLLVVVGIIVVVVSLSGGGGFKLFATKTPTPTITPTPTNTFTPTLSPTITETPTITPTATASAPFLYVVQEGDTLTSIIEAQGLGDTPNAILIIYMLNPYNPANVQTPGINPNTQVIFVGQTITLPNPGMALPTPTPPPSTAPGTRITYMVLPGDGLGLIANKWNSTIEAIVKANPDVLTDGEETMLYPGMLLVVPINIVTPVPTATLPATPTLTATP